MKNKPKISVIMSVYNGMPFLREAVESILKQTYKNFAYWYSLSFTIKRFKDFVIY